jgi:NAD(P)-dependent dehydrogenase (short-subunit alcohol dehydrogenase family)
MPVNFIGAVFFEGTKVIPYYEQIKRYGPYVVGVGLMKRYFMGTSNTWERQLHGRVVLITGGTSGVGACIAQELAQKGAQIILLVKRLDEWVAAYVEQLRELTNNELIYAEEADLGDFYSIRKFATRWIDNTPPRPLHMIVCCAAVALPPRLPRHATADGLEQHLQVNYLGHYHLLTLLEPAIKAQPADRDVRIILATCVSSVMADFDITDLEFSKRGYPLSAPWKSFGASKLELGMFAYEFQRQMNAYERPDKLPNNVHLCLVDPGLMRSPSFKRFVSFGSLFGLLIYLILWPIWWLFLKSSAGGAESFLYAAMAPDIEQATDVSYISDCRIRQEPPRKEYSNEALQRELFKASGELILETEKKTVVRRKQAEASATSSNKGNNTSATANVDNNTSTTARIKGEKSKKRKT